MSTAPSLETVLKLQQSLAESQWWGPDRLLDFQFDALDRLITHAYETVPFYRRRIEEAGIVPGRRIDQEQWRRLPILTRREVQDQFDALKSTRIPSEHGTVVTNSSSGSTGMPVRVLGTAYDALICKALVFRFHLWHDHDFEHKLASIRMYREGEATYPDGARSDRWGDTATYPIQTGPACRLNIRSCSVDKMLEWLRRETPAYLMTYPSLLRSLLQECDGAGLHIPELERVLSNGETLPPDLCEQCREVWSAGLVDIYSANEVDQIAHQCPEHKHYHVQAERMLVEVLDDDGRPCQPGEIGRVVVTPLYNYAMPLLRYALGDFAEVGALCNCGRGLPVLRRVLGRVRNTLVTPDGHRYWPNFGTKSFREIAPVIQHQFVQTAPNRIECHFVVARPLTRGEEAGLLAKVGSRLPGPFELSVTYPDEIPRSAGGKHEDFYVDFAT